MCNCGDDHNQNLHGMFFFSFVWRKKTNLSNWTNPLPTGVCHTNQNTKLEIQCNDHHISILFSGDLVHSKYRSILDSWRIVNATPQTSFFFNLTECFDLMFNVQIRWIETKKKTTANPNDQYIVATVFNYYTLWQCVLYVRIYKEQDK